MRTRPWGFSLIELLVVLAAMAVLLGVAAPRYMAHLQRAEELALRHNLRAVREAIEQFSADRGRGPSGLEELVVARYLREPPEDPITRRRDSWRLVMAPAPETGLADVRSGAEGRASDGSRYADW